MNNLIKTLVVEALDGSTDQDAIHATDIANSASTGRLAIQVDGAFQAGDASAAAADAFIKMSAATAMADGSTSVMSSSEFKKGDILSANYKVASSAADVNSSVDYSGPTVVKLGGQFFVRLERKDGQGINDSETYAGETVLEIVNKFKARKKANLTEFDNVTFADAGSSVLTITISARDENSGVIISANDNAAVTTAAPADNVGSLTIARELEKLGFISQGAYNQYKFPIVNPETSTLAGQDYGIYTIELRKKVGGRYVFETIKVLIQDDEASGQKTVNFIENVLGLSAADLTAPAVTSVVVSMVTDEAGETAAGTTYSNAGATAIFVKATNLEVGTTATLTINSTVDTDAGHASLQTFNVETETEVFPITVVDAGDFAATSVIKATLTLTDGSNNVSAGKVQATGITIQA